MVKESQRALSFTLPFSAGGGIRPEDLAVLSTL